MADPLVVRAVVKSFDGRAVLRGVDLDLAPGEAVALLGPSGSGKSTLLNILGSLEKPDSGTVHLGSLDVSALKGRELERYRSHRVGFVFQEHGLLPQLTARENALLPTLATRLPSSPADEALKAFGVYDRRDQFPATLSGGERQRVAVARALANDPDLLLCDEPTGSLDREAGDALVDALLGLARRGKSVLVVTHNEEQAARFGRVVRLLDGRLA